MLSTQKELDEQEFMDTQSQCARCFDFVHEDEINQETDYECKECREVERCDCGEDINKCDYCAPDFVDRWIKCFRNLLG